MKQIPFTKTLSTPLKLLQHCVEIFGHPVTPSAVIFFSAVGCADEEVVVKAMCDWLKTGRRFPCPADIRELIEANSGEKQGTAHV